MALRPNVSRSEVEEARRFERAGLTTYSQALRTIERAAYDSGYAATLAAWRAKIAAK